MSRAIIIYYNKYKNVWYSKMELYGIKIIPDIFILVFIGVVFIIICLHVSHYVFAFSSPFTGQEIIDPKPNDWTLVNTPKESTFQVNNFFNNTPVNLLYEQNITACEKAKEKDEKENHFHPPDISSVTYRSDGKTLNATIWLSSPVCTYHKILINSLTFPNLHNFIVPSSTTVVFRSSYGIS
jgi:hypothetical protein